MMRSTALALLGFLAPRAAEIERAGKEAGAHQQMAADQQVLGHGHVREELGVLEGAADPRERNLVDRHVGDVVGRRA